MGHTYLLLAVLWRDWLYVTLPEPVFYAAGIIRDTGRYRDITGRTGNADRRTVLGTSKRTLAQSARRDPMVYRAYGAELPVDEPTGAFYRHRSCQYFPISGKCRHR